MTVGISLLCRTARLPGRELTSEERERERERSKRVVAAIDRELAAAKRKEINRIRIRISPKIHGSLRASAAAAAATTADYGAARC